MKWWYWLVLELLIIFGVMAWVYFFPSEIEYDFAKGLVGFALIHAIEVYRETNRRKTMDYKEGMTCGECLKYEYCPVANLNPNHKACMRITTKEYHTIEQNAGENRIEGGVVGISGSVDTFRCWKCGRTLPISERADFIYMSNPPKYACKECEGIKKEKQYRPFNDCDELIKHYQKKNESEVGCGIYFPSLYKPCIWVKSKEYGAELMITGFNNKAGSVPCVFLEDMWKNMDNLFNDFTFLDGSPVGKLDV